VVKIWRRLDPNWILVGLLAVVALAPLTYPGFFQAHSGYLPTFAVQHLAPAEAWPLSLAQDPGLRGEGRLPYLLAWPFYALSGSGIVAIKWGYGLAFLLGALGVYAWTRRRLGTRGGVLAAVVYTYLPWHLASVYVRGAYAEAWLWAAWPYALWAVDRLAEPGRIARLVAALAGIAALAALAWSQPGLAVLSLPLLVACGAATAFRRRGLALRLGLSAALLLLLLWWLGRYAAEAPLPFADQALYPFQLLSAAWGHGISVAGWADGQPFQLGLAAVGLTLVALALWGRKPGVAIRQPLIFWAISLGVVIMLPLAPALFVWEWTGLDRFLTYPWQILALSGLPLAFLAGSVVRLDRRLVTLPAWSGLLALVILASYPYLAPEFSQVDPGPEPVAVFQEEGAPAPQMMILDYQIAPPTEITPTLTLTLTWQTAAPVAGDYTVFVHLLAEDGSKIAQRDTRPCDGTCPTDSWRPGEIVVDRYPLDLPADPAEPTQLAVGLYQLETGQRPDLLLPTGRKDNTVYIDVP